jgi:hypothetical protein
MPSLGTRTSFNTTLAESVAILADFVRLGRQPPHQFLSFGSANLNL